MHVSDLFMILFKFKTFYFHLKIHYHSQYCLAANSIDRWKIFS
jgi:hypothetical protein